MILRHAARSLFSKLPRSLLYETFYQSARALGVRHYGANGPVGTFFGPLYDQSVIKPYLRTGSWSDNIVGLFQEFFRDRSGTLYDIGANIGLISVPVARNLRVRVVAFEPDGENCALLRANAAFAEAAIEIVNAAVAEHAGTLSFKRSEYNCGDHRLSGDGSAAVTAVALDDYPPGPGGFAVKIDTQGAEPLVFKGGKRVLARADLIVSEFWPWGMQRTGLAPDFFLAFAAEHFARGFVLRHDQAVGEPNPIGAVMAQLRSIVASAGEHDAADVVLLRE